MNFHTGGGFAWATCVMNACFDVVEKKTYFHAMFHVSDGDTGDTGVVTVTGTCRSDCLLGIHFLFFL